MSGRRGAELGENEELGEIEIYDRVGVSLPVTKEQPVLMN